MFKKSTFQVYKNEWKQEKTQRPDEQTDRRTDTSRRSRQQTQVSLPFLLYKDIITPQASSNDPLLSL